MANHTILPVNICSKISENENFEVQNIQKYILKSVQSSPTVQSSPIQSNRPVQSMFCTMPETSGSKVDLHKSSLYFPRCYKMR